MHKHKNPHVGIALIIRRGDSVLLGKRLSQHGFGKWSCPGGHLELWESFEDCAKRECLEECGLVITKTNFLAVENTFFKEEGKHYVVIFLVADFEGGMVSNIEPDKCSSWHWIKKENLPYLEMLPGLHQLLNRGVDIFATLV
jgi:8-oxo-dGTP diphosphatase